MASLFSSDEELGKKDDDHKYGSRSNISGSTWQHRRVPTKRNVKRVVYGILGVIVLYLFFKNMPDDLNPHDHRPRYNNAQKTPKPVDGDAPIQLPSRKEGLVGNANKERVQEPMYAAGASELPGRVNNDFDGPIKFYQLANSLRISSAATGGNTHSNQNVLFAAASLKSAAVLVPLACSMASWRRNNVHFALFGRDNITMDVLKDINGADSTCKVIFHDARPDFSRFSTDHRMESSVSAAFRHIEGFLHPQAILIDDSGVEDLYFLLAMRKQSSSMLKTLIELPKDVATKLMWLTRLDSASLNAWNKVSIDIVIHGQPAAASGALLRLLTSLWHADYSSSPPPRLTIELPNNVEPQVSEFLQSFKWPPSYDMVIANANRLVLRKRLPRISLTPEENSLRFVESFWPADRSNAHILVLSPHVELSPLFYPYLKYLVLEYKYSLKAWSSTASQKMIGISLAMPSAMLDDKGPFMPPKEKPYLWQAPNSNAALYFGNIWTELHSMVGLTVEKSHRLPTPTTITQEVSKTYPSWLEHILRLARLKGYHMHYPSTAFENAAFATVRHDLYNAPDEYDPAMNPGHRQVTTVRGLSELTAEFKTDPKDHISLSQQETRLLKGNLLDVCFPDSLLPSLEDLPVYDWKGMKSDIKTISDSTLDFQDVFKREIGGCTGTAAPGISRPGEVNEWFCDPLEVSGSTVAMQASDVVESTPATVESVAGVQEKKKRPAPKVDWMGMQPYGQDATYAQ